MFLATEKPCRDCWAILSLANDVANVPRSFTHIHKTTTTTTWNALPTEQHKRQPYTQISARFMYCYVFQLCFFCVYLSTQTQRYTECVYVCVVCVEAAQHRIHSGNVQHMCSPFAQRARTRIQIFVVVVITWVPHIQSGARCETRFVVYLMASGPLIGEHSMATDAVNPAERVHNFHVETAREFRRQFLDTTTGWLVCVCWRLCIVLVQWDRWLFVGVDGGGTFGCGRAAEWPAHREDWTQGSAQRSACRVEETYTDNRKRNGRKKTNGKNKIVSFEWVLDRNAVVL